MPITLGTNIASLRGQRQLVRASDQLATVFERLSSGQRINRASDDAAGLAVSSKLNVDARVYGQAIRNVNDAVSAISIVEGSLSELTNITVRLKELAEQSSNGIYSSEQREALQLESDTLVAEYNRIIESTSYNDIKLLEENGTNLRVQAGIGLDASLVVSLNEAIGRVAGDGTFQDGVSIGGQSGESVITADFNNDGNLDIARNHSSLGIRIYLGDGQGGIQNVYNSGGNYTDLEEADFNNDGILDIITVAYGSKDAQVLLGNGDGTFQSGFSTTLADNPFHVVTGDLNGDGNQDFIDIIRNGSTSTLNLFLGDGNGGFTNSQNISFSSTTTDLITGDFDNDGLLDIVGTRGTNLNFFQGNGDGTVQAGVSINTGVGTAVHDFNTADLNDDGILDLVSTHATNGDIIALLGDGDGSFTVSQVVGPNAGQGTNQLGDVNGDGIIDIVNFDNGGSDEIDVYIGYGDGTFYAGQALQGDTDSNMRDSLALGDLDNDGALDIVQVADNGLSLYFGNTQKLNKILELDMSTAEASREALDEVGEILERITTQIGQIGSDRSRLATTINNLTVARENFTQAASRILDADIAQESAALTRFTILQQASASVLAQANIQPQLALRLLGGVS